MAEKTRSSTTDSDLIGVALNGEDPLRTAARHDPDIRRAVNLIREADRDDPACEATPWTWCLVRALDPQAADRMAQTYLKDEPAQLSAPFAVKSNPHRRVRRCRCTGPPKWSVRAPAAPTSSGPTPPAASPCRSSCLERHDPRLTRDPQPSIGRDFMPPSSRSPVVEHLTMGSGPTCSCRPPRVCRGSRSGRT